MIEQRTDDWRSQRAGKITASRFTDAISTKTVIVQKESKKEGIPKITAQEPTAARNTYMRTVVAEILSGRPKHEISSKSLSWGSEAEVFARKAYEIKTGLVVVESGFLLHPVYEFIGCSPDGLVGLDGGVEMKSPHDEQVHINTLLSGMPDEHMGQVQGCMAVTSRKWWDFISYDPRQAEKYRLYVQRIYRDDQYIDGVLMPGLLKFWDEVQEMIRQIDRRIAA